MSYIVLAIPVFFLLFRQQDLSRGTLALGAGVVLASLVVVGGFLERKSWAVPAEGIRLRALATLFVLSRLDG